MPYSPSLKCCVSINNTIFMWQWACHLNEGLSPELPLIFLWLPLTSTVQKLPIGITVLAALFAQRSHLLLLPNLLVLTLLNFLFASSFTSCYSHPRTPKKKKKKGSAWNVHWDLIHILYQFPDHKTPYWQRQCSMIMPKRVPFTLCLK